MEDVLRADYGDAAQKAVNDAARAKSKPSNAVSGPRYPQSPLPNLHPFYSENLDNPDGRTPDSAPRPRRISGPKGARARAREEDLSYDKETHETGEETTLLFFAAIWRAPTALAPRVRACICFFALSE